MDPPRSVLYVPASRADFLERLPALRADAVVLDLEDGVAPAGKDDARRNLGEAADRGTLAQGPPFMVRVNGTGTAWHDADVALAASLRPRAVVLPKAEDILAVTSFARRLADQGIATALMIETATGVGKAPWLAGAHTEVRTLIYGSADLRLSLGARPDPERDWERSALDAVLLAARMHGCAAIDAAYFRYRDADGLRLDARIARDLGYDGKSCIHPGQLDVVHEVFASTLEEVAWAEGVLRVWESQHGAATGVAVLDGEMIEALHVDVARRLLARRSDARGGSAG